MLGTIPETCGYFQQVPFVPWAARVAIAPILTVRQPVAGKLRAMADRLAFYHTENRSRSRAVGLIVLRRALSIAAVVIAPWLVIAAVICALLRSW